LVFEHFIEQLFHNDPMGRSVLGTRESLAKISSPKMRKYRDRHFAGSRVVVSAAGNVNHDRLVNLIAKRFENVKDAVSTRPELEKKNSAPLRQDLKTSTQQAHIVIGCRSVHYSHKDKYVMLVLNTLLGGGMSSRLFQRVREKNGLAYSVFSFLETYGDTGIFGVYAGTDPDKSEKALNLIKREIRELSKHEVSDRELRRTKDQLKGNLLMGLESPSARMNRLAKMEIYTHDWMPIDEVVNRIDAVTTADIRRLATQTFIDKSLYTTLLLPN
ncbi:M16 family metallopeptidase, partial [Calditrichota bacterium]